MSDLQRAIKAIQSKQYDYRRHFAYYDGTQKMPYLTARLADIFKGFTARVDQNWSKFVINTALDRISFNGFTVAENETAQQLLAEVWADQHLQLEANEAHRATLVAGEAFVMVWKDEETGVKEVYYNPPWLCHVFYKSDKPREKQFAAKAWKDDDTGRYYCTLYYTDRIEYYYAEKVSGDANQFKLDEEAGGVVQNPYGIIPVFHLRPELRRIKSQMDDAINVQDGISLMLINLVSAAEFSALPLKWIISNTELKGKLKTAPNNIWQIPASDGQGQPSSTGVYPAADLSNFIKGVEFLLNSLAVLTHTPKHYILAQGGDPSGEALIAMEAPLNKKVTGYIECFEPTWQEVAAFLLSLDNIQVKDSQIKANFSKPETVLPLTTANIRQIEVNSGIPLINAVRREGWEEADISQLEKDMEKDQEQSRQNFANAMLSAERGFNNGNSSSSSQPDQSQPAQPQQAQQPVGGRNNARAAKQ